MSGTVNIARALLKHEAFKDQPFTEREAFMWLIMEASWKERTKRVGNVTVTLERGQLAASVRFLAEAWQWEKSTVDRFLQRLKKRDMIGTESGTGINVITVCNYNEYQTAADDSGTPKKQKRDSSGTAAGQTRIPEVIPEARKREEANASHAISRFWAFWEAYPHRDGKRGRKLAEAKFAAAVKRGVDPETIIAGAVRARADPRVIAGYARDPTTWLNQAGWEDEPDTTATASQGSKPNERRAFDQTIAAIAPALSAGTVAFDNSSRDPFAVRPRRDTGPDEYGAIPLFRP